MPKFKLFSYTNINSIPTASRDPNGVYFIRTAKGFDLYRVADTAGKELIPLDMSSYFKANSQITLSQLNDINLAQGNYKAENYAITGLPNTYNSIINFGQYSGGGYSQQLAVPFGFGEYKGLWLRTSNSSVWSSFHKMWDDTDFSQAYINSWKALADGLNVTEVAKPKVYAINSNHYYSSIYASPLSNNSIYSLGTMVLYSNGYWYSESIGDRSAGAGVPTYRNDMRAGAVLSSTSNNLGQQLMFDEIGQIYARGGTGAWNRFWSDSDFSAKSVSNIKLLFQTTFRARYIKLTASSVSGWNGGYISMTELEVYSDYINVALNKTVTWTNITSFNGQPASILVDGDTGGFSYFNNTNILGEVVIDLGAEYDITHVTAHGYFDIRTKVSHSLDGTTYQAFTDIKGVNGGPNDLISYTQLQKDVENSRIDFANKTQVISTNSSVNDDVKHVIRWDNGTGDIDLNIPLAVNFKDRIITISNRNSDSSIRYINLTGESVYHSLGLTIDKLTSAKFADSGSGGAFPDRFSSITIKSINTDGLHWVWVIVNSNGNQ